VKLGNKTIELGLSTYNSPTYIHLLHTLLGSTHRELHVVIMAVVQWRRGIPGIMVSRTWQWHDIAWHGVFGVLTSRSVAAAVVDVVQSTSTPTRLSDKI